MEVFVEVGLLVGVDVEVFDVFVYILKWFVKSYVGIHLCSILYVPWVYGFGYEWFNWCHLIVDGV